MSDFTRLLQLHGGHVADLVMVLLALPEVANLVPTEYLGLYFALRAVFGMRTTHRRERRKAKPVDEGDQNEPPPGWPDHHKPDRTEGSKG